MRLLTMDVGNTNTVLGVHEGTELIAHWRLTTRREQTADEYGILVRNLFSSFGVEPKDVAGVALATVSRVVNGKPGVSPAMRARVEAAIERLDYRRNVNASSLRRLDRKTATIGLVLEDVANPFMSALHRAVEDRARERGILVFAGSCDEDSRRGNHGCCPPGQVH